MLNKWASLAEHVHELDSKNSKIARTRLEIVVVLSIDAWYRLRIILMLLELDLSSNILKLPNFLELETNSTRLGSMSAWLELETSSTWLGSKMARLDLETNSTQAWNQLLSWVIICGVGVFIENRKWRSVINKLMFDYPMR